MSKLTNVKYFIADKETCSIVELLEIVHYSSVGIKLLLSPRSLVVLQSR
jgi:hypothetical protein